MPFLKWNWTHIPFMGLLIQVTFTYITASVLLGSKVFCFYCLFGVVVIAVAILIDVACVCLILSFHEKCSVQVHYYYYHYYVRSILLIAAAGGSDVPPSMSQYWMYLKFSKHHIFVFLIQLHQQKYIRLCYAHMFNGSFKRTCKCFDSCLID